MMGEIRTKGYASSFALLKASNPEPQVARRIINLFEDRRVFWAAFQGEMPPHVRKSLDEVRRELRSFRDDVPRGGPLDAILLSLLKTTQRFYGQMALIDLDTLRCDSGDPEWSAFEGALTALRKSVGLQTLNLAASYGIGLQGEFAAITEVSDNPG